MSLELGLENGREMAPEPRHTGLDQGAEPGNSEERRGSHPNSAPEIVVRDRLIVAWIRLGVHGNEEGHWKEA